VAQPPFSPFERSRRQYFTRRDAQQPFRNPMARPDQTVDGEQIDERLIRPIERVERPALITLDEPARAEQLPGMPIRRILLDGLACQVPHLRPASLQQAPPSQLAPRPGAGTAVSGLGKR